MYTTPRVHINKPEFFSTYIYLSSSLLYLIFMSSPLLRALPGDPTRDIGAKAVITRRGSPRATRSSRVHNREHRAQTFLRSSDVYKYNRKSKVYQVHAAVCICCALSNAEAALFSPRHGNVALLLHS